MKGNKLVAFVETVWDDLSDEDEEPPSPRRQYQCAEPVLFSNYRYVNSWDSDSDHVDESRAYMVNTEQTW
jgi:hypothetical protein